MKYRNDYKNGRKLWYATMRDRTDEDWGTGSFGFQEAAEKVLEWGGEAYIAVIDGDECIGEVTIEELKENADNEIASLRELSGMKRRQFCDTYGIPYRTMEDWEKGNSNPPEYVQMLLERAVRQDKGLQSTFYVMDCDDNGNEWTIMKTMNKLEAIKRARDERYIHTRDRIDNNIEIRIYAEDIEDEECSCFDYDTIDF